MKYWINDPATDGIWDKIKMAYFLLEPNIPTFHHSIIPPSGQIRNPKKIIYYQSVIIFSRQFIMPQQALFKRLGLGCKLRKYFFYDI
jgi:hypothetical protein